MTAESLLAWMSGRAASWVRYSSTSTAAVSPTVRVARPIPVHLSSFFTMVMAASFLRESVVGSGDHGGDPRSRPLLNGCSALAKSCLSSAAPPDAAGPTAPAALSWTGEQRSDHPGRRPAGPRRGLVVRARGPG